MKLYLVKRTDEIDWDEYDAFVVAAENEDQAKGVHSGWGHRYPNVEVKYIGEAAEGVTGEVLGSFNAG